MVGCAARRHERPGPALLVEFHAATTGHQHAVFRDLRGGGQERSVERTHRWAQRCVAEHERLTAERTHRPYQALFGVVQGAQHEDLRRQSARELAALEVDGFGIGGALEKDRLGTIVRWVCEELPEGKPRHLLGIGEPDDVFTAVANGADTFDCVAPSRNARGGTVFHPVKRFHLTNGLYKLREGAHAHAHAH